MFHETNPEFPQTFLAKEFPSNISHHIDTIPATAKDDYRPKKNVHATQIL